MRTSLGLERQYRGQPAGLRTYMIVAIASANFTQVGALGFASLGLPHDPMRVAAQVVTGIVFLGAGAIWHAHGERRGLTAAGLWISAAIGMMSAAGKYTLAVSTAVVVGIILRGGSELEKRLNIKARRSTRKHDRGGRVS